MVPFKNILIPVDSLYNAQIAVDKALELSEAGETTVYLVAIIKYESFWHKLIYTNTQKQPRLNRKKELARKKFSEIEKDIK